MTPRQRQIIFRKQVKTLIEYVLASVIIYTPVWMIIHWVIFGY